MDSESMDSSSNRLGLSIALLLTIFVTFMFTSINAVHSKTIGIDEKVELLLQGFADSKKITLKSGCSIDAYKFLKDENFPVPHLKGTKEEIVQFEKYLSKINDETFLKSMGHTYNTGDVSKLTKEDRSHFDYRNKSGNPTFAGLLVSADMKGCFE